MSNMEMFTVGAIQPEVHYCSQRGEIYNKNLMRHLELIDFLIPYWSFVCGAPCRLVVFPEFALHGLPQNSDLSWNGVAIDLPGEETAMLSEKAKAHNIYIASHAWTEYPDFKGRPFSVAFLIAPDGEIILKHHKSVTSKIAEAGSTSPADAYDWFVEKFGSGLDAFFPVAETEIGKMGFQICGEGGYPETGRALMMNGAEIILRPNAWIEPYMDEPMPLMDVSSRAAASTNLCYLVESNWAHYHAPGWPKGTGSGRSQIIDYNGRILARTYEACESGVASEINIQNLRRVRENVGFGARMAFLPTQIFRKAYEKELWPLNSLMEKEISNSALDWEVLRQEVINKRRDIYTPSE